MFLTEGNTCRLPHTPIDSSSGDAITSGTDVYIKIYNIATAKWWDGTAWSDVETELSASHWKSGGWYYDLPVAVGLSGDRIQWIFYSKVATTTPRYEVARVAPADSVYELGLGIYTVTFHVVDDEANDVPYAYVVVYSDGTNRKVGSGWTDASGEVDIQLEDTDYDVRVGPIIVESGGVSYSPETPYSVTVTTDETIELEMTKNEFETDGYTFGNMKSQVARILLDVFNDRFDNDLIEGWIRQAHIQTDTEIKWTRDELEITTEVAKESYYTIASQRNIICITDANEKVFPYTQFSEFMELDRESQGTPSTWTVWGERIMFNPVPSSIQTYTVWAVRVPAPLVCDGDIPSLPAELHQAIVDYALHRAYVHLEDMIAAQVYYDKWAKDVRIFGSDAAKYRGRHTHVVDTEDF